MREVVRRFGANPRVVALQIANEVNLTFSQDSSDGAYDGAREALVQGVIAAKDEARRRGLDRLEIGFNWAYRTDPGERGELLALAARSRRPRVRAGARLDRPGRLPGHGVPAGRARRRPTTATAWSTA